MNEQAMQMMQQLWSGNGQAGADVSGNSQQALFMQLLENMKNKSDSKASVVSKEKKLVLKLKKSKRVIQQLEEQLKIAETFMTQFAELVGACPQCFGQVSECSHCRGQGGPGFHMPDPELLEWVSPALDKMEKNDNKKLAK